MKLTVIFLCLVLLCHDTGADVFGSILDDILSSAESAVENAKAVILNHTPFEYDRPLIIDLGTGFGETGDEIPQFDTVKDVSFNEANIKKEGVPEITTPTDNIHANTPETDKSTVVPPNTVTTEDMDKPGDQDVTTKKPVVNSEYIETVTLLNTASVASNTINKSNDNAEDVASSNNVDQNGIRSDRNATKTTESTTSSTDLVTEKSIEEANGNEATTLSSVNIYELGKANSNEIANDGTPKIKFEEDIFANVLIGDIPEFESPTGQDLSEYSSPKFTTIIPIIPPITSNIEKFDPKPTSPPITLNSNTVQFTTTPATEENTKSTEPIASSNSVYSVKSNNETRENVDTTYTETSTDESAVTTSYPNEIKNYEKITTDTIDSTRKATPSDDVDSLTTIPTGRLVKDTGESPTDKITTINPTDSGINEETHQTANEIETTTLKSDYTSESISITTQELAKAESNNNDPNDAVTIPITDSNLTKTTIATLDASTDAGPAAGNNITDSTTDISMATSNAYTTTDSNLAIVPNILETTSQIDKDLNKDVLQLTTETKSKEELSLTTNTIAGIAQNNDAIKDNSVTDITSNEITVTTKSSTINLSERPDILSTSNPVVQSTISTSSKPTNYKALDGINTGAPKTIFEEDTLANVLIGDIPEHESTTGEDISKYWPPIIIPPITPLELPKFTTIIPVISPTTSNLKSTLPDITLHSNTELITTTPSEALKTGLLTLFDSNTTPKEINTTEPATIVEPPKDFKPLTTPVISPTELPNYTTIGPIESTTTRSQQFTPDSKTLSEFPLSSIDSPGPLLGTFINSATETLSPDASISPTFTKSPSINTPLPLLETTTPSIPTPALTTDASSTTLISSTMTDDTVGVLPVSAIPSTPLTISSLPTTVRPTTTSITLTPSDIATTINNTTVSPTKSSITTFISTPSMQSSTKSIPIVTSIMSVSSSQSNSGPSEPSIVTTSMNTETSSAGTPSSTTVTSTTTRKPRKDYKLAVFINFLKSKLKIT